MMINSNATTSSFQAAIDGTYSLDSNSYYSVNTSTTLNLDNVGMYSGTGGTELKSLQEIVNWLNTNGGKGQHKNVPGNIESFLQ